MLCQGGVWLIKLVPDVNILAKANIFLLLSLYGTLYIYLSIYISLYIVITLKALPINYMKICFWELVWRREYVRGKVMRKWKKILPISTVTWKKDYTESNCGWEHCKKVTASNRLLFVWMICTNKLFTGKKVKGKLYIISCLTEAMHHVIWKSMLG